MVSIYNILIKVKYFFVDLYYWFYSRFHKIEKKVLFQSFAGKQYSDNPRAISEKLHEMFPEYKIIWKLDEKKDKYKVLPNYIEFVPDEKCKFFPFQYLY